jgi:fructose-bisphosphate aldolase class II
MTITNFDDLMAHADEEQYAVGYFECWNLESLMAVADAVQGGFQMVMFSDEQLSYAEQKMLVKQIVEIAHPAGVAVEGEAESLHGIGENQAAFPAGTRMTSIEIACEFVEQTGVDAFAVNIGQRHFHGRREARLDQGMLKTLMSALDVPLVLHGSTSVPPNDLAAAVENGISKINVGSALKQAYFEALRNSCAATGDVYNPYQVIGSGLPEDVSMAGRIALQQKVEQYMQLFRSNGKAFSFS